MRQAIHGGIAANRVAWTLMGLAWLLVLAPASGSEPMPAFRGATGATAPLPGTVPHTPIFIDGDANFTVANGVTAGRGRPRRARP